MRSEAFGFCPVEWDGPELSSSNGAEILTNKEVILWCFPLAYQVQGHHQRTGASLFEYASILEDSRAQIYRTHIHSELRDALESILAI